MAERNIHVKGMSELSKFLDTLPQKLQANVLRAALAQGAKIVRDAAVTNCPVGPPGRENARIYGGYAGALRDSIRFGSQVRLRKGKVIAYVRAGGHARGKAADTYYVKFVEYGTMPHGKHPGTSPHPFMRPALDAESEHALAVIANFIKNRLEQKHGLDTSAVVLGEE